MGSCSASSARSFRAYLLFGTCESERYQETTSGCSNEATAPDNLKGDNFPPSLRTCSSPICISLLFLSLPPSPLPIVQLCQLCIVLPWWPFWRKQKRGWSLARRMLLWPHWETSGGVLGPLSTPTHPQGQKRQKIFQDDEIFSLVLVGFGASLLNCSLS